MARQRALEEPRAPRPRRRARGGRAPTRSRRRPRVRSRALAHRRASKTSSSQVPVAIGLSRVRRPSDGFLEKSWKNCSNSLPVLRIFAAGVIAAGLAATSTPASTPTRTVPQGVSIAGVRVGGLSAEPARARIETRVRTVDPRHLPGQEHLDQPGEPRRRAERRAPRSARPSRRRRRATSRCPSATRGARLDRHVAALAKRFDRPAVDADGCRRDRLRARSSRRRRPGSQSTSGRCAPRSPQLLRDGTRAPLTLLTHPVAPTRTAANFGPVSSSPVASTRSASTTAPASCAPSASRPARRSTRRPPGSGGSWTSSGTRGGTRRRRAPGRRA